MSRLKHASKVFGQGSLIALAMVALFAVGAVVLARLEGLPQDKVLQQLGLGLLMGASFSLLAALGLLHVAEDTDYFWWLLHRLATELSREEIVGIRLTIYAFNQILQDAAGAILVMAGCLGVASIGAIVAARLAACERAGKVIPAGRYPMANALALQVKKNKAEPLTLVKR